MDNTDEMALNENAGEETSEISTPDIEPKTPTEATEPTSESEPAGEETNEGEEVKEEKVSKKGAEARIRELNAKAKEAESEVSTLKAQLEELTAGVTAQGQSGPYMPQVKPGQEIAPEQYQQDVMKSADALVQLRLKQQDTLNNINSEAEAIMSEFTELNPDSKDTFNKELSDAISESTMAYVSSNLHRLKKGDVKAHVKKMIKPYKLSLTKEVADQTDTITKQVAAQALRPQTSIKTSKSNDDKTIEELEKELGFVF